MTLYIAIKYLRDKTSIVSADVLFAGFVDLACLAILTITFFGVPK